MGKKEIEIKTWLTREEMVTYLQELAACLSQGRVVLQRGSEYLELTPAQSLELEMEGVRKKGQQKISLEITWRQVVLEPVDDPLLITSEVRLPPEPVMAEPEAAELAATQAQGPEVAVLEDLPAGTAPEEEEDEEKPKKSRVSRK